MAVLSLSLIACILLVTSVAAQSTGSSGSSLKVNGILLKGYLEQSSSGSFSGFIPDLLNALSASAGFTYTLALQPDGNYGSNSSGAWNGLIGSLVRKETDIAAADLTITSSRDMVVDFVVPFASDDTRLLVKKGTTSLNGLRYLVQRATSMEAFLKGSTDAAIKAIWADIQANNGFITTEEEGVVKAAQGEFAVLVSVQGTKALVAANNQVELFGTSLQQSFLALGVQQGSVWRDKLGIGMSQLSESGQLKSMMTKWGIE